MMNFGLWIILITQLINISKCWGHYHELSMKSTKMRLADNSLFGYSVSYLPKIRSLAISAPKADTVGQVFIYDIKSNNLTQVDFNVKKGDNNSTGYWLGAEVKAGDTFFTTCAPRYETVEGNRSGTFGQCFLKSFQKPQKMEMLQTMSETDRSRNGNKLEQRMDSFGWSIDVISQNNILIGGPVMFKGRVIQYKNISDYPRLLTPSDETENNDTLNFGYSIASGNYFSSNKDNVSYAVSTPYGNKGIGQIHFFNKTGDYIGLLTDNESALGALFGATLCTARFDEERSSLLIGAPAYVSDDAHGVDLGAVHVYLASGASLSFKRIIRGQESKGRFGSAIVALGDLDSDNKDDIAIAAPYENDGHGAVYIYTSTNILSDKMEIMYAQKIQNTEYKAFGLSLAVLQDYDQNGCNELAIGAPYSNAVAILSCFSAINVNLYTVLPNLQNRNTTHKTKFSVQTCLNVTYSDKPENIAANISVKVSIMHPSAKLENSKNGILTYIVTVDRKKSVYCRDVVILSPMDKNNELYPIQITANAQLENDPRQLKEFIPERVVLGDRSVLSDIKILWISGCNSTFCIPVLQTNIVTSMVSPYLIGSSNSENVSVAITNFGETAYNPCARIGISTVRVLQAPGCRRDGGDALICEPRNPLRTNQTWNIGFTLETKLLTSKDKQIAIHVDTFNHCGNSTNRNSLETTIDLEKDFDNLFIKSESIPSDTVNVSFVYLNTDLSHLYTVVNNGVTNWVGIKFLIILNNALAEIRSPILIVTDGQKRDCHPKFQSNVTATVAICELGEIRKSQNVYIMVNLKVPPLSDDSFTLNRNVSIVTDFLLVQDYEIKAASAEKLQSSVSSTLVKVETPVVPIWIYIAAGCVAVLVLVILVVTLYEIGFLQRKNKKLLKDLKQDVRRQTVRRTMKLREEMRASRNQTAQAEIEPLEESMEKEELELKSSNDMKRNLKAD